MKPEKNTRFREMRLGKIGLLVLVAGMGILVTLAFLLGVQVGRGIDTYPEKIVRGIPGRIAAGIGSFFAKASPQGNGDGQESQVTELTFFDTLTKKRGDAGNGLLVEEKKEMPAPPAAVIMVPGAPVKPPGAEEEKMPPPPPPLAPTTVAPPPVVPPAAKVLNTGKGSAPAPSPVPMKVSPPAPPQASGSGIFSVQVVSYHERDKAKQLKDKLRGLGFRAEIVDTEIPGKGKWYRVVVNGYQTRVAAEKAASEMAGKVKGLNCVIKRN